MPNEDVYFYVFIYASCLSILLAALFMIIRYLIKRGRPFAACITLIGVIFADLIFYSYLALPNETLPRKNVKFAEWGHEFSFPKSRSHTPPLDKRFRYFVAPIKNIFIAFDIVSLDKYCPILWKGYRYMDVGSMLESIKSSSFPLQKEIMSMNMTDFISMGRNRYNQWNGYKKEAYLNFLELTLEDMQFERPFYIMFIDGQKYLDLIMGGVNNGYLSLRANRPWAEKDETVATFMKLIQMEDLKMLPDTASTFLIDGKPNPDSPVFGVIKYHDTLYKQTSCFNFFLILWVKYKLHAVHTFVCLKDYEEIMNVYERFSNNMFSDPASKRIEDDLGVNSALIKFSSRVRLGDKGGYVADLTKGGAMNYDIYIEKGPGATLDYIGTSPSNFSYEVKNYNPNKLEIKYKADVPGYLYYADCYDKYWHASIDKKDMLIYRANGAFKAVKVPAGQHQVEFIYDPVFFRIALWLYYLTTIGCVVFLTVGAIHELPLLKVFKTR